MKLTLISFPFVFFFFSSKHFERAKFWTAMGTDFLKNRNAFGIVLKYRLPGLRFALGPSYFLCCSDYTFN